jgi:hypothetical protein
MRRAKGERAYQRPGDCDGLEERVAGLRGGRPGGGGGAKGPRKESRRQGDGAEGVGGIHAAYRRGSAARRSRGPAAAWGFGATPERVERGWGAWMGDCRIRSSKIETAKQWDGESEVLHRETRIVSPWRGEGGFGLCARTRDGRPNGPGPKFIWPLSVSPPKFLK